jgi:hypothetical protein
VTNTCLGCGEQYELPRRRPSVYCSRGCVNRGRTVPPEDRFWRQVSPEPNTGCWLWAGNVSAAGYGLFSGAWRVTVSAHRMAYRLAVGEIPAGAAVCHHCDTRTCVNPAHLFVGTQGDNIRDCAAKGRLRGGGGLRRLTPGDALAVRLALSTGVSAGELAQRYGVRRETISKVRTGVTWARSCKLEPISAPLARVLAKVAPR